MASGASVGTVQSGKTGMETLKNIPLNIKELKPNLLLSVPALAKSFKKNIESSIRSQGAVVNWLFNTALKMSYSYNKEGFNRGQGLQMLKKPLLALFDKIIFSKIVLGPIHMVCSLGKEFCSRTKVWGEDDFCELKHIQVLTKIAINSSIASTQKVLIGQKYLKS